MVSRHSLNAANSTLGFFASGYKAEQDAMKRTLRRRGCVTGPVQTLDSVMYRINHYPADKCLGNKLHYPVDRD